MHVYNQVIQIVSKWKHYSHPRKFPHPFSKSVCFTPWPAPETTTILTLFSPRLALLVVKLHINGTIQYVLFYVRLSLHIMFLRSSHIFPWIYSVFFTAELCSRICIYHPLMKPWAVYWFWWLWIQLLWTFLEKLFCGYKHLPLLEKYWRTELHDKLHVYLSFFNFF